MPDYTVLKPFGWNGTTLKAGQTVEIEQGSKANALMRAKFVALIESGAKIPATAIEKPRAPAAIVSPDGSVVVYCVKCKIKRSIIDAKLVTLKHGRQAMQGKCSECGTKLHRMKKKVE